MKNCFRNVIVSFLFTMVSGKKHSHHNGNKKIKYTKKGIVFVQDDNEPLGFVNPVSSFTFHQQQQHDYEDTKSVLRHVLKKHSHATGREKFHLAKQQPIVVDNTTHSQHIRFEQTVDGLAVAGAALMMHIDASGSVYAVNGEFVPEDTIDNEIIFTCEEVFPTIIEESNSTFFNETDLSFFNQTDLFFFNQTNSTWLSECNLTIVVDRDGQGHKAWQRLLGYQPITGPYQIDLLFASVLTGEIVAVHPQVFGALALETYNCKNTGDKTKLQCQLISDKPHTLNTDDAAVNDAHNYAKATYDFYYEQYGRDSVDNKGLLLRSLVHYGVDYNNAFWSGRMTYGDGDGVLCSPLSTSIEVVGHELTHGVTQHSSSLVYRDESGALNEALSDIFGAAISRNKGGQSFDDVWLMGEDIWTPKVPNDALRSLADPARFGNSDLYETRYRGTSDGGGVHTNSGIANLAFKLLVTGGAHPRYPHSVVVPAIDANMDQSLLTAAQIFYMANIACLTPQSGFFAARACTLLHAGKFAPNVADAWSAVGVTDDNVLLNSGVALPNQAQSTGTFNVYTLPNIPAFSRVTCTSQGDIGDLNLYVDLYATGGPDDTCLSTTSDSSNEACTVGPTRAEGTAIITTRAVKAYSGVTLKCTVDKTILWPELKSGVVKDNINVASRGREAFVLNNVPSGSAVSCIVLVSDYSDSLYVQLIAPTKTVSDSCSAVGQGGALSCSVGPIDSDGTAYVLLGSDVGYTGSWLMCTASVPVALKDGVAKTLPLAATGSLTTYFLPNVPLYSQASCAINGANGDTDLVVRLDTGLDGEMCASLSADSTESCTVGPALSSSAKMLASVYAWSATSQMTIQCTLHPTNPPCSEPNQPCRVAGDCCIPSQGCYGESNASKTCKACAAKRENCVKHSDCCGNRSRCNNKGVCIRKSQLKQGLL